MSDNEDQKAKDAEHERRARLYAVAYYDKANMSHKRWTEIKKLSVLEVDELISNGKETCFSMTKFTQSALDTLGDLLALKEKPVGLDEIEDLLMPWDALIDSLTPELHWTHSITRFAEIQASSVLSVASPLNEIRKLFSKLSYTIGNDVASLQDDENQHAVALEVREQHYRELGFDVIQNEMDILGDRETRLKSSLDSIHRAFGDISERAQRLLETGQNSCNLVEISVPRWPSMGAQDRRQYLANFKEGLLREYNVETMEGINHRAGWATLRALITYDLHLKIRGFLKATRLLQELWDEVVVNDLECVVK